MLLWTLVMMVSAAPPDSVKQTDGQTAKLCARLDAELSGKASLVGACTVVTVDKKGTSWHIGDWDITNMYPGQEHMVVATQALPMSFRGKKGTRIQLEDPDAAYAALLARQTFYRVPTDPDSELARQTLQLTAASSSGFWTILTSDGMPVDPDGLLEQIQGEVGAYVLKPEEAEIASDVDAQVACPSGSCRRTQHRIAQLPFSGFGPRGGAVSGSLDLTTTLLVDLQSGLPVELASESVVVLEGQGTIRTTRTWTLQWES